MSAAVPVAHLAAAALSPPLASASVDVDASAPLPPRDEKREGAEGVGPSRRRRKRFCPGAYDRGGGRLGAGRCPPQLLLSERAEAAARLEVRAVEGKGEALFARVPLPRNTRIPYEGVRIDQAQYERLLAMERAEPAALHVAYVMAAGRAGAYIDAHPLRAPRDASRFAAKANEPDRGATANMLLLGGANPTLVTVRDVSAGAELTYRYGNTYARPYKSGRGARRPRWLQR